MLEALITSKTRVKLLLKFFLNPETSGYLRSLASEFGESSNAIRLELGRLEKAGMLESENVGNKKWFRVNIQHPLYRELSDIVRKYIGLDVIVENVVRGLGNLEQAYLTGDLAEGRDAQIIDLVLVGDIDQSYLVNMVEKAEKLVDRKIRYIIYQKSEAPSFEDNAGKYLLIWTKS